METKFEILREMFETSSRENSGWTVYFGGGLCKNFALTVKIKPVPETAKGTGRKVS